MMDIADKLFYEFNNLYVDIDTFLWKLQNGNKDNYGYAIAYLLKHDFANKVTCYGEFEYYTIKPLEKTVNVQLKEWLELEYKKDIGEITRKDTIAIFKVDLPPQKPIVFFEKKELLSLDFLNGLLHFDDIPQDKPPQNNIEYKTIGDILKSVQDGSYVPPPPLKAIAVTQTTQATQTTPDNSPELLAKVARLQKENAQLHAKIAELTAKRGDIGQQGGAIGHNNNDKQLPSRTANNASKIISALASELLGMDLTKPFANDSNGKIMQAIEKQGNELSKDTIAEWLKLAHDNSK